MRNEPSRSYAGKDKNESVINTDRFDRRRFGEILKQSPKLAEIAKTGTSLYPNFQPLMGDLWAGLFKTSPRLLEEVDPSLAANRALVERVMTEENFELFRRSTVLDDFTSAIGTVNLSEQVYEWVKEQAKESSAMKRALQALKQAMQEQQQNEQEGQNGDNSDPNGPAGLAAQALAEALNQAAADGSLGSVVKKAMQDTKDQESGIRALVGGSKPGDEDHELSKTPLRQKLALANLLQKNKKLRRIADWAGRLKAIAMKKQRNKHQEATVKSGIEAGNDLWRLLPTELANFKRQSTRRDFLRRYAEGQLMQYEVKGKEQLGKGPFICLLDRSGSMEELDEQSLGFALALGAIAKRQKRDFALIPFTSKVGVVRIWEKGKIPISDYASLAELHLGGSTDFVPPLKEALSIMAKSRFKNADLIFITDGEARYTSFFDKEYHPAKKQLGFSTLSIKIGDENGFDTLQKMSDEVVCAEDFMSDAAAKAFEI